MPPKKKRSDVNLAIEPATWRKIGELIMTWAQNDGTSDDLMDLFDSPDPGPPDEFWPEFERRLQVAFVESDARPFVEQVYVVHPFTSEPITVHANLDACRKALRSLVLSHDHSTHGQNWKRIDAWDGQSMLVVGAYRASPATVQL